MSVHCLGLGAVAVTDKACDQIVIYGLGSCVGLFAHYAPTSLWGAAHVVRPKGAPGSSHEQGYFAGTAVPALMNRMVAAGADGGRAGWSFRLVGGAAVVESLARFDVGRRNVVAVRRALWRVGAAVLAEDVGGRISRTVRLDVGVGVLEVSNPDLGTWRLR